MTGSNEIYTELSSKRFILQFIKGNKSNYIEKSQQEKHIWSKMTLKQINREKHWIE